MLQTYFAGWSYQQHLGYVTSTQLSYLAPLSVTLAAISAAWGPMVASVLYPALVAALSYLGFLWYAASQTRAPTALVCVAAVFFFGNAFTTAFIHEGYASIVLWWALLPVCLRIVDLADEKNPALLLVIPVLFWSSEMFQYPEVVIDGLLIALFRLRTLVRILASNRLVLAGLVCGFAINCYWALPLIVYLKAHAAIPILAETKADVDAYALFSSFSNVALLRALPPNWTAIFNFGVRECTFCDFYLSPAYVVPMIAIAAASLWGLLQKRWFGLAAITLLSLALGTGYHYRGTLLGLPYELLMSLPLFGIFRGAGLFVGVAIFGYGMGICAILELFWHSRLRVLRTAGVLAICACVALACGPWLSGAWIERGRVDRSGANASELVEFPNFPVTFPQAVYSAARDRVRSLAGRDDAVTLLAPEMPYADYTWGAYGNDFLYAYLGIPTLSSSYWPEPNARVGRYLARLYATHDPLTLQADLAGLRVGATLVHRDVWNHYAPPPRPSDFGRVVWRRGALTIARPAFHPVPMLALSSSPLWTLGLEDEPRLSAGFGRSVLDWPLRQQVADCSNPFDLAWGDLRTPLTVQTPLIIHFPVACPGGSILDVRGVGIRPVVFRVALPSGRRESIPLRHVSTTNGIDAWRGFIADPAHANIAVSIASGSSEILGVELRSIGRSARPDVPISLALASGAAQRISYPPAMRLLTLNQSFDPEWAAFETCNGRWQPLEHVLVDGYANGFELGGCGQAVLINWAQIAFLAGLALSVLAAIATAIIACRVSANRATLAPE